VDEKNTLKQNELQCVTENGSTSPAEAKTFKEFRQLLGITSWDFILFTDGSGSGAEFPGGYGVVVVERKVGKIELLYGAANRWSVNRAEAQAVFEGLSYVMLRKAAEKLGGSPVIVITDSTYVANALNQTVLDPVTPFVTSTHQMVWAGVLQARRMGIMVKAIHVPRNSNPMMVTADALSKLARQQVKDADTAGMLSKLYEDCDRTFKLTAS